MGEAGNVEKAGCTLQSPFQLAISLIKNSFGMKLHKFNQINASIFTKNNLKGPIQKKMPESIITV